MHLLNEFKRQACLNLIKKKVADFAQNNERNKAFSRREQLENTLKDVDQDWFEVGLAEVTPLAWGEHWKIYLKENCKAEFIILDLLVTNAEEVH